MFVARTLQLEEVPNEKIAPVVDGMNGFLISKTASRQILGTMNEIAFSYAIWLRRTDEDKKLGLTDMIKAINGTPMTALGMSTPSDMVKEYFEI